MMHRRNFIRRSSLGLAVLGHSDILNWFEQKSIKETLVSKSISELCSMQEVSVLSYEAGLDHLFDKIAYPLTRLGFTKIERSYLISEDQNLAATVYVQIVESVDTSPAEIMIVAGKSSGNWKFVHMLDTFELRARKEAMQAIGQKVGLEIDNGNILVSKKIINKDQIHRNTGNGFYSRTLYQATGSKTSSELFVGNSRIWSSHQAESLT